MKAENKLADIAKNYKNRKKKDILLDYISIRLSIKITTQL